MKNKLKVLDTFSGIGGFSLGLERTGGFETVAFCEIDGHARKVLKKHWPNVPICEDITKLTTKWLHDQSYLASMDRVMGLHQGASPQFHNIDVVTGGFPCQDISVAGQKKGLKGERSGLWSQLRRVINEVRPKYAIIENVANLRGLGLSTIIKDLAEIGYSGEWHIISARSIGACHLRERIWIIAWSDDEERRDKRENLFTMQQDISTKAQPAQKTTEFLFTKMSQYEQLSENYKYKGWRSGYFISKREENRNLNCRDLRRIHFDNLPQVSEISANERSDSFTVKGIHTEGFEVVSEEFTSNSDGGTSTKKVKQLGNCSPYKLRYSRQPLRKSDTDKQNSTYEVAQRFRKFAKENTERVNKIRCQKRLLLGELNDIDRNAFARFSKILKEIWIIAYPNEQGLEGCRQPKKASETRSQTSTGSSPGKHELTDSDLPRLWRPFATEKAQQEWWSKTTASFRDVFGKIHEVKPTVCRGNDGLSDKLDERKRRERIKQLGNAVLPQIPELIGDLILEYEQKILTEK